MWLSPFASPKFERPERAGCEAPHASGATAPAQAETRVLALAFAGGRDYWHTRLSDIAKSFGPSGDLVPGGDETYLKAIAGQIRNVKDKAREMAEEKKRKTSPAEFVNQVRTETSKVVWPTREETIRTSIFVFIFMVILSLFFFGIDSLFNAIVKFLLSLL